MVTGTALAGAFGAWRYRWLCDDAHISFRYAENLAAGRGLVFNTAERVEGFTNFLWTVWIALGVRLGVTAESWAIGWGVASFAGACGVLAWIALRDARADEDGALPLPWAGIVLALHPDAMVFGTSGLETGPLMCALVVVLALVTRRPSTAGPSSRGRRAAVAGLVAGIAAGLRPDAVLLAPIVALVPLLPRLPGLRRLVPAASGEDGDAEPWDLRCSLWFLAGVAAIWLPLNGFRVAYFGDFFPNTYYAKSADRAWWDQGLLYLGAYYQRYGAHLCGIPLALAAVAAGDPRRRWPEIYIGLGFVLLYTLYVTRVGGDFMYARLLIPTAPLLAAVAGAGLEARPLAWRAVFGALIVGLPWVVPSPLGIELREAGISDERAFYATPRRAEILEARRRVVTTYLSDTGASVAFLGAWAQVVRAARLDPAIESETGLTDPVIARQALAVRGIPGHEKRADPFYLADERRVDFALDRAIYDKLDLHRVVPPVEIVLPDPKGVLARGVVLYVIRWDPELIDELEARGAEIPDVRGRIERMGERVATMPLQRCRFEYRRLQRLYFDQVNDPALAAPFERRCPVNDTVGSANRPG